MSASRKEMDRALRMLVVPGLRTRGFKGSLPHFRRAGKRKIDLFTIQFDHIRGGRFVVEIGACPPDGVMMHWGEKVPPEKVTAHDLHPNLRHRLGSPKPGEDGRWFRFDDGTPPVEVATELVSMLGEADRLWSDYEPAA